mgnify:CR=1 FL=1
MPGPNGTGWGGSGWGGGGMGLGTWGRWARQADREDGTALLMIKNLRLGFGLQGGAEREYRPDASRANLPTHPHLAGTPAGLPTRVECDAAALV